MGWFNDVFWSVNVWLPPGYTWKDYESTPTLQKAEFKDFYQIPAWVLAISITRYIFEQYIATPFCGCLGIKHKEVRLSEKDGQNFNNGASLSPIRRKQQNAAKKLKKATETCWRFVVYMLLFLWGCFVLFRTDWFLDNSKWYPDHVHHPFTWDMKIYYFLELSFYLSLLISQFVDVKRRDFYQLFVHHVTTIILLTLSYICSFYRFGVVILFLHDVADVWLEAAKLTNYAKIQKVCDVLFAVFGILFFFTRLVYYPLYVAYAWFHYREAGGEGHIMKCVVTLSYLLLVLHCYWGWLIGKMAYRLIVVGKVEKDTRSESEDSE